MLWKRLVSLVWRCIVSLASCIFVRVRSTSRAGIRVFICSIEMMLKMAVVSIKLCRVLVTHESC